MAHLWKEDRSTDTGELAWVVQPLDGEGALSLGPVAGAATALLLRSRTAEGELWLAMSATPAGVALNGVPLHAGIRVLADRDEIRVAGLGRVFFSTEQLAGVTAFPGTDARTFCPRCKQAIDAGTSAVRCPACQRWYHQSDEYPCWAYTEACLCGHPTALGAGFQWTPSGL
jgi:hypothetical protein